MLVAHKRGECFNAQKGSSCRRVKADSLEGVGPGFRCKGGRCGNSSPAGKTTGELAVEAEVKVLVGSVSVKGLLRPAATR